MSGLSSRVMNMKFMQKQDQSKTAKADTTTTQKKITDSSEWAIPHLAKLLKLAERKPKIEIVGYGGIMSAPTRRSWGTQNEEKKPEEDDVVKITKESIILDDEPKRKTKKDVCFDNCNYYFIIK